MNLRRKKTGKRRKTNIRQLIRSFKKKVTEDRITVYSAQASFNLVMSSVPMLFLLMTILKFTPLTEAMILDTLGSFLTADMMSVVERILSNLYQGSFTFLSLAALSLFWAAGSGIMGLTNGLNSIYSLHENRNYFVLRLRSSLYAILLVLVIILALGALVFGLHFRETLIRLIPALENTMGITASILILIAMVMMTLIFAALYAFLPSRKMALKDQIYGAVFTTLSWCVFSYFFSVYLKAAKNLPILYGGMITFMVSLFWLFICLCLFFFGAEFNAWLENPDSFPF